MVHRHILVTGGSGQIGRELSRLTWASNIVLHCPPRDELDLAASVSVSSYFAKQRWDCVINCAAWTAVDAAEDNVGAAFLANALGATLLAEAAAHSGCPLIHVSTDYVFSGDLDRPYRESDAVGPIGAYGASKLAGELGVRAASSRSIILRTAWVVSAHGNNFLKTMLRLGGERNTLSIVADQHGCPTSAADIAAALQILAMRLMSDSTAPTGVYHFVNAGEATWHELAKAIFELGAEVGGPSPDLAAIPTSAYPTLAARPANSRLETGKITRDFGIVPRPWRAAIQPIITELLAPAGEGQGA